MSEQRERRVQRTWTLSERLALRVKALAEQNEIWDSAVVEKLLQRALDAVDSGEWPLRRIPVKYRIDW